jgi:hypothetical protein
MTKTQRITNLKQYFHELEQEEAYADTAAERVRVSFEMDRVIRLLQTLDPQGSPSAL